MCFDVKLREQNKIFLLHRGGALALTILIVRHVLRGRREFCISLDDLIDGIQEILLGGNLSSSSGKDKLKRQFSQICLAADFNTNMGHIYDSIFVFFFEYNQRKIQK